MTSISTRHAQCDQSTSLPSIYEYHLRPSLFPDHGTNKYIVYIAHSKKYTLFTFFPTSIIHLLIQVPPGNVTQGIIIWKILSLLTCCHAVVSSPTLHKKQFCHTINHIKNRDSHPPAQSVFLVIFDFSILFNCFSGDHFEFFYLLVQCH